ncbi:MAG TPA: immunoglobulin domain-containing protein [Candidatus Angelobacter sp.]|nr:immunoglobulin domain-containing protein [Candidatus Angelobacter sp.]
MKKFSFLGLIATGLLCTYSASATSPNDAFSNSIQLSGTNVTYSGTFDDATLEPGEPHPYGTNTVWFSWAAPATGPVQISATTPAFGQAPLGYPAAVFTGATIDDLQAVATAPIYWYQPDPVRFLAVQGVVYKFQISGPQTNYTFSLQSQPYGPCINDYFTNAILIQGDVQGPQPIADATMELGEPAHWGSLPVKSLWWKWPPQHWSAATIDASSSLASNYVIAVYEGNSVDTLGLVAKATNSPCQFTADGGATYYIAAAAPTNEVGDIRLFVQTPQSSASHIPDGNVLYEPSWEGTAILNAVHWQHSGSLGGWVNENGGADGTTWPELPGGTAIWQDFPTIRGHRYAVRFACKTGSNPNSGETGDALVAVAWDNQQLGTLDIPEAEIGYWHWDNTYSVIASNTTSEIAFTNVGRTIQMDAFSVVDVSDPPVIVTQPGSISSVAGGSATFAVGATGTEPLQYQWYFQDMPIEGANDSQLELTALTTNQIGDYHVVITNNFGMVTSAVASLLVDVPHGATILFEPYGDTVPVGNDYNFTVVATGTPPLSYQWFFNGANIEGATNQNLALTNVQSAAAGVYTVRVKDRSSTVFSLPATLTVSTTDVGGGQINFANWFVTTQTNALPVFDVDGTTLLSGSEYMAQLYAGPDLASLRPVGQPTPFQSSYNAGYFVPQTLTLGNVAPGSNAVVQVRAWDTAFGSSFEAARTLGGRFGASGIFQVVAGGNGGPPANLQGLQSFSLQAGLPYFQVATLQYVREQPLGTLVWALHGQPGYIYSVEKRYPGLVWQPFTVVTNITGTVNFTSTLERGLGNDAVLYRARILN